MTASHNSLWHQGNAPTSNQLFSEEKVLADLEEKKQERLKVRNDLQVELDRVNDQLSRLFIEISRLQENKKSLEQKMVSNRTIPCPELRDLLIGKIIKTGETFVAGCKAELSYSPVYHVVYVTIQTTSKQEHDLRSFLINHKIIDADLLGKKIDIDNIYDGGITYKTFFMDQKSVDNKDTYAKVLASLCQQEQVATLRP